VHSSLAYWVPPSSSKMHPSLVYRVVVVQQQCHFVFNRLETKFYKFYKTEDPLRKKKYWILTTSFTVLFPPPLLLFSSVSLPFLFISNETTAPLESEIVVCIVECAIAHPVVFVYPSLEGQEALSY
jgi:hypothetical protein